MGMFDKLTCYYKLPLPEDPKGFTKMTVFQTKNFENFLEEYKIDEEGNLWKCKKSYDFDVKHNIEINDFTIEKNEWSLYPITNTIQISNYYIHNEEKEYDYWITYELVIIKGKVDNVKIINFEATPNRVRKDRVSELIKSFEKRDQFENTFLYRNIYKHYNSMIDSLFKSLRIIINNLSRISWKIENILKI